MILSANVRETGEVVLENGGCRQVGLCISRAGKQRARGCVYTAEKKPSERACREASETRLNEPARAGWCDVITGWAAFVVVVHGPICVRPWAQE